MLVYVFFFRFYGRLRLGLFVWKRLKSRKGHDFIYVFFQISEFMCSLGLRDRTQGHQGQ